jgi:hypothetical protein
VIASARTALARSEKLSGQQRRDALTQLAAQLTSEAQGDGSAAKPRIVINGQPTSDSQAGVGGGANGAKVRMLVAAVTDLANAEH